MTGQPRGETSLARRPRPRPDLSGPPPALCADGAVIHGMCTGCGHHTSAWIGGSCTAFVPGPPGGPLATYCGHDCRRHLTDTTTIEENR